MKCVACSTNDLNLKYESVIDEFFGASGKYDFWECAACHTLQLDASNGAFPEERYPPAYSYRKIRDKNKSDYRSKIKDTLLLSLSQGDKKRGTLERVVNYLISKIRKLIAGARTLGVGKPTAIRKKLLDVGCGDGAYLEEMRLLGWEVQGVETSRTAVEICLEKNLPVNFGRIEDLGLKPESYDVITVRHVIEHIENPLEFLCNISGLISKHGRILITTPNATSANSVKYKQDWLGLDVSRHENIFSLYGIKKLIEQTDLEIEVIKASHRISRFVNYAGIMRINGRNPYINSDFAVKIESYIRSIYNRIRNADGDEIFLILKRK